MKIIRSLKEIEFNKLSVVTIGTFDGVHKAHLEILKKVIQKAKEIYGRSVVVTFDPHPREVIQHNGKIELLTTLDEKLSFFKLLGIDIVFIVPFTFEFSRKTYMEFYNEYIINTIGVTIVVEGSNHHVGRDREGGMNQIIELGKQNNFTIEMISDISLNTLPVSSSTIKSLLHEGKIVEANFLLGYEYHFSGTVVRGRGMGRKLGYPTANIKFDSEKKLIPKIGVYAVKILVRRIWYNGMMSIGVIPTFFEQHDVTVEVNIFDFDDDIYDETVTVQCVARTRDEKKFESVGALITELGKDKIEIQQILDNYTSQQ
ncbi:MAG: riboflavin biosynthesis protein RibF [Bacteroidetes bacterium]|nr:riboflavin biosynthesis protein RibF [Bacteroidota bacterium]